MKDDLHAMLQSLSTRTEYQKHIICQEKSQRNARLEKVLGSTMSVIFACFSLKDSCFLLF